MSRREPVFAALAAGALVFAGSAAASAQTSRIASSNWRQHDRQATLEESRSPWAFAFEIRLGPYKPNIDEVYCGDGTCTAAPYGQIFNYNPQVYFGLEVDWLPLRIPYVGRIGAAFGWGFTTASAQAKKIGTDGRPSNQDSEVATSLTIMPMHLSGVLRVDQIMKRTVIPVVPYGKFGFGFAMWDMSEDGETARYTPKGSNEEILARSISVGTHVGVGMMLGLNWLGGRSNASLYDTTGIRNTYFFGEWMYANLGSEKQPHVGTSTWVLGLAADM